MDERSLQGLLSNLIPDEIESLLTQSDQQAGEQQSRAVELLNVPNVSSATAIIGHPEYFTNKVYMPNGS